MKWHRLYKESDEQVNLKKLLKMNGVTKLPSGTEFKLDRIRWSKDGGYAGQKTLEKICSQLEDAGWKRGEWRTGGIPDGSVVTNSNAYTSPDGQIVMTYSEHYGATAHDNYYGFTFKLVGDYVNESNRSRFKVGDYVQVIKHPVLDGKKGTIDKFKDGQVLLITGYCPDGHPLTDWVPEDWIVEPEDDLMYQEKTFKFKVGDNVKVVGDGLASKGWKGTVKKINPSSDWPYVVGFPKWWKTDGEYSERELASIGTITEENESGDNPKFKKGDMVRCPLASGMDFYGRDAAVGRIEMIKPPHPDVGVYEYLVENGRKSFFAYEDELELIDS